MKKIKKAILPVAGFGTRLLPATKAQPKEMLPIVDKPAIQYLVESAVEAGIEEVIFITGRGKRAIEDHFDYSFELEHNLVEKEKHGLLEEVRKIGKLAKFSYVRQNMPLGDGHAIACAGHLIADEPVLVIFGDCLYDSQVSPARQVIDLYEKFLNPVIGLAEINRSDVGKFGVIDGRQIENNIFDIHNIVEKPKAEDAPSNIAAVGVYVITPDIFKALDRIIKSGKNGEIRLVDAFLDYFATGGTVYGKKLEGEWLDTGDKFGFIKAAIALGLKHSEVGDSLRQYLKNLNLD